MPLNADKHRDCTGCDLGKEVTPQVTPYVAPKVSPLAIHIAWHIQPCVIMLGCIFYKITKDRRKSKFNGNNFINISFIYITISFSHITKTFSRVAKTFSYKIIAILWCFTVSSITFSLSCGFYTQVLHPHNSLYTPDVCGRPSYHEPSFTLFKMNKKYCGVTWGAT